jgi:putative transposase
MRSKIVAAVDAGRSKAEVARVFGVGLSTVKRYLILERETGSLAPKRHPGPTPAIDPLLHDLLCAQLDAHPEGFLDEHCQWWEEQTGVRVSIATMSRAIKRLGWTRKKGRWVPANETRTIG